jgi:hypothetical protein
MIMRFKTTLTRLILITAVLSLIPNITLANPDPDAVSIMPVGGVYYGDGYPEWIKESYVLITPLSATVSFDIEIHNDNNKASPDDFVLEIWINDPSYTSCISNITVDGNTTSNWYTGKHQGINGAYRNYTVGSIGAHSIETLNITVVFSSDAPADLQMHFDAHNHHWHTKQSHDATVTSSAPASCAVQIGIDQPMYVHPQDQFIVDITVDPQGIAISAVQYDLYYNTSVVWAEWANPGPFLKQDGAKTDVLVLDIDNRWNVADHKGKISYAETILGSDGNLSSVNTSGTITTIQFSAIGERNTSSYLNFSDIRISDPDKHGVPHNCSVTIYDNIPPVANASSKYWVSNVASRFQCFAVLCCCNSHGGEWGGDEIAYVRWDFGDGQYGTSEDLEDCRKHHIYTAWNWNDAGYYDPFIAYLTVRDAGVPQESNTTRTEVVVYIAGDTNGDGKVDIFDAACVGKHWGQKADNNPPDPCCTRYWTDSQADEADLNNDNDVDTLDAMIVGTNWNHLAYPPYYQE